MRAAIFHPIKGLFVALLALSSVGCIPLIMAANAHSKEQQAQADQDNTLTCWQNYRDQVEALPDIASRGMRAQQRRDECHDQYSDEPEMCSDTDLQTRRLEGEYTRVKLDSREARKECERMDLQTRRSTAAAPFSASPIWCAVQLSGSTRRPDAA